MSNDLLALFTRNSAHHSDYIFRKQSNFRRISCAIHNKFNKFIRLTRYNSKHIAEHGGGRQRVSEIRKSRKLIKIK